MKRKGETNVRVSALENALSRCGHLVMKMKFDSKPQHGNSRAGTTAPIFERKTSKALSEAL